MIVLGDFNAHLPMRDFFIPDDARGKAVEEWKLERDLLNNGKATCIRKEDLMLKSVLDLSLAGRA